MKRKTQLLASLMCLALCGASVHAANKYWDINGTTAGAGGATPTGNWTTTDANWSTDSTGSAATAAWSGTTDTAIFSAGTDATGSFTVTVPTALTVAGLKVEEGTVSKASGGGAITVGTGTITVSTGAKFSIDNSSSLVASSGSICALNGSTMENRVTTTALNFLPSAMKITVAGTGGILSFPTAGVLNILQTGSPGNVISGTGGITKVGAGILAVATACTYSGPTVISEGTLRVRTSNNRLPISTDVTIASGAALDPGSTSGVQQQVNTVNGAGNITFSASSWLIIKGNSDSTVSGIISDGASNGRLYKGGTGTLTLSGVNTFDGRIVVTNGTVTASPGSSLMGSVGDVYMGTNTTLNLNNDSQALENLVDTGNSGTPAATVNLNGNGSGHTLTLGLGFNSGFSGTIAGVGGINVNGAIISGGPYTLTLSGNNTYNGGTTLGGGTLIMTGNNTGNGAITINGGMLKLTGANPTSGATMINGGKLLGVTGGSLANSAVTVGSGATNGVQVVTANGQFPCAGMTFSSGSYLDFDFGYTVVPGTTVAPLQVSGNVDLTSNPTVNLIAFALPSGPGDYPLMTWSGTTTGTFTEAPITLGPLAAASVRVVGKTLQLHVTANKEPLRWATGNGAWDINTSFNWTNSADESAKYTEATIPGDQVVFEDTKSGAGPSITVTLDAFVTPANVTADNTLKDYTISGSGSIQGGTVLTKKGTNKLTLSGTGTHTYSGGTIIEAGTLQLGDGTTDCIVQGNIVDNDTLSISNVNAQLLPGDISGTGKLIKGSAGTLTLASTANTTFSGGQSVYDGTLTFASIGNEMRGPVLADGPNARILLSSSGYIGDTGVGAGDVTLDHGGTLENVQVVVGGIWLTPNRSIKIGAGGGIFKTGGTSPTDCVMIYAVDPVGGLIAGVTPGVGTLTFNGPGEFRTYGAHNSFGKLVVAAGEYTAGHGTAAAYNDSYGAIPAITTADAITVLNGSQLRLAGGTAVVNLDAKQGITMGSGGGVIRAVTGLALGIPSGITGSGPLQLGSSADAGIIALAGANTFNGGVTLYNGTICINSPTALGDAASTVTINSAALNPIIRNTNGSPITLINNNPQNWNGNFTFSGTSDLNLGAGAVSLNAAIAITNTANTLTVGGVITEASGGLSLTKYGAGTLTLTAANNYSGGTIINGGTLDIQKDGGLGSGNATVASGATLKLGSGTANTYINSAATLTMNGASPLVNLAYTGTPNTINALFFGATQMPAGTWGGLGSGATHQSSFFTGSGKLIVTTGSAVVASQPSTILSITNAGGGNFNLQLQGTPAAEYYLVANTNVSAPLNTWTQVPNSTTNAPYPSGVWGFTVNAPAAQFYRLRTSP